MNLAFLTPHTFSKTSPTCDWSGPGILETPGSHRTNQNQSYMILVPHIFSKTPPTYVLSGPGSPGSYRTGPGWSYVILMALESQDRPGHRTALFPKEDVECDKAHVGLVLIGPVCS